MFNIINSLIMEQKFLISYLTSDASGIVVPHSVMAFNEVDADSIKDILSISPEVINNSVILYIR